jgi:general stress protein YciG
MNSAVTKYLAEIGRNGGKVGGLSTSSAKAAAARENGKRGGRPKKKASK